MSGHKARKPDAPKSVKKQGFSLYEKMWIVNQSEKDVPPKTIAREIGRAPSTVNRCYGDKPILLRFFEFLPTLCYSDKPILNHFQRLDEVKELKIFFFAQRAKTRKQASSRPPLPWRQQSRTAQARGAQMLCLSAEDQRPYNSTSLTARAHRGSLSKRRELVLSSLFL